jgi:hypothetical protein
LCFYFIAHIQATTARQLANTTVCYDNVGCFNNLPPFDNAAFDLPRAPADIGTKFLLFTRTNPHNPDTLEYVSQASIASSHYQRNLPTKLIIHGFSNNVRTQWLHTMKDAFLSQVRTESNEALIFAYPTIHL